jgi:uncharacterized membrane protein
MQMNLFVALIYSVGAVICHQIPERSFFWQGQQLPVCARCTGLYLSGAAGILGWLVLKAGRRSRPIRVDPRVALRVIAVTAIPTLVTFATGVIGLWDGSNVTRALLAIPVGASAGAAVAAVFTKDLR